jgi:hypothetical protein
MQLWSVVLRSEKFAKIPYVSKAQAAKPEVHVFCPWNLCTGLRQVSIGGQSEHWCVLCIPRVLLEKAVAE